MISIREHTHQAQSPMTQRKRIKRRGFSFLEVLCAVFVASLCAVIVSASLPVATNSRLKADLNNKATNLAQRQLERIRGTGYPNLSGSAMHAEGLIDSATPVTGTTYSFTTADAVAAERVSAILPSGVGRVTIDQVDLDLRRVTVSVSYTDRGQTRTVLLGTLVANL